MDASGARYQQQLDKINEFVHFHRLPRHLSRKLRAYNTFMFNVNRGFDVDQIAAALPMHLQQEVFLHLHEHLVRQVPMFAQCDDGFIKSLVRTLKPQVLMRGDCAFKAYEAAQTMYFIQNGCVQIVNHAQTVVHITLFSGAYFGELAMLTRQKRTGTALAATDCILFYMTAEDFEEVIKDYPTYYYTILDKAMERLEKVLQKNTKEEEDQPAIEVKKAEGTSCDVVGGVSDAGRPSGGASGQTSGILRDNGQQRSSSGVAAGRKATFWVAEPRGSDVDRGSDMSDDSAPSTTHGMLEASKRKRNKKQAPNRLAMRRGSDGSLAPLRVITDASGIVRPNTSSPNCSGQRQGFLETSQPARRGSAQPARRASAQPARRASAQPARRGSSEPARRGSSLAGFLRGAQNTVTGRLIGRLSSDELADGVYLQQPTTEGDAHTTMSGEELSAYMNHVRTDVYGRSSIRYCDMARDKVMERCFGGEHRGEPKVRTASCAAHMKHEELLRLLGETGEADKSAMGAGGCCSSSSAMGIPRATNLASGTAGGSPDEAELKWRAGVVSTLSELGAVIRGISERVAQMDGVLGWMHRNQQMPDPQPIPRAAQDDASVHASTAPNLQGGTSVSPMNLMRQAVGIPRMGSAADDQTHKYSA
jgi:CRP-like cAMP-binding protein